MRAVPRGGTALGTAPSSATTATAPTLPGCNAGSHPCGNRAASRCLDYTSRCAPSDDIQCRARVAGQTWAGLVVPGSVRQVRSLALALAGCRLLTIAATLLVSAVVGSAAAQISLCPAGWTYYYDSAGVEGHDSCVWLSDASTAWTQAATACRYQLSNATHEVGLVAEAKRSGLIGGVLVHAHCYILQKLCVMKLVLGGVCGCVDVTPADFQSSNHWVPTVEFKKTLFCHFCATGFLRCIRSSTVSGSHLLTTLQSDQSALGLYSSVFTLWGSALTSSTGVSVGASWPGSTNGSDVGWGQWAWIDGTNASNLNCYAPGCNLWGR